MAMGAHEAMNTSPRAQTSQKCDRRYRSSSAHAQEGKPQAFMTTAPPRVFCFSSRSEDGRRKMCCEPVASCTKTSKGSDPESHSRPSETWTCKRLSGLRSKKRLATSTTTLLSSTTSMRAICGWYRCQYVAMVPGPRPTMATRLAPRPATEAAICRTMSEPAVSCSAPRNRQGASARARASGGMAARPASSAWGVGQIILPMFSSAWTAPSSQSAVQRKSRWSPSWRTLSETFALDR
mmetsp:Transcript_110862/g.357875  ORF Transcript_110862/g.357875 Transcript_110862/m.357875 type:complete len:237 (-) Transcript_110862:31-741(-)